MLNKCTISNLKQNLNNSMPVIVENQVEGQSKEFCAIDRNLFNHLVDNVDLTVGIERDTYGECVLKLIELDIKGFGTNFDEALNNLIHTTLDYAHKYQQSPSSYPSNHLTYLLKIWNMQNESNLENKFKYTRLS